jgi:Protein of unknown function (DUF1553)/Protein of unknown function (DUF1549)
MGYPLRCVPSLLVFLSLLAPSPAVRAEPVSFRNEVMAILSRAGCNQGTCHGNQNGKNGFKLSLRGEDPAFDFAALTRDTQGRRTNPHRPGDSLILLKAVAAVPHEGGKRFGVDTPEYDLLARWIAGGLQPDPPTTPVLQRVEVTPAAQVLVEPTNAVQLRVQAHFSDGSERDVTRLAVYEPSNQVVTVSPAGEVRRAADLPPGVAETAVLVRYLNGQATVQLAFVPARDGLTRPDTPEANFIDHHVFAKLHALRLVPSGLCTDSVFVRRIYLDLLGILPTAGETRTFLADSDPDKRRRLVDRLLERPEFADFWALKWADLLRNEEKVLDRKGVRVFHEWLRQCLLSGKPLNEFARELIAARGSTYSQPPANFYRALRDPHSRAEAVAQVFLGIRLQCAKCHNHPFDRWTQEDYHRFAAFFARVDYRVVENNRRDLLDKHEFDGEQIVWTNRTGELTHPRTGATLRPRFLGEDTPDAVADGDRLQALADWVARPDNPFFARTQVNRVWQHLLGRGIVDPLDDFRASNPPVNGPLLDALTADFVAHGFDLRHLIRTIAASRTYQLAAAPNETNREDESNFSRAIVRPLQAEQLLDALCGVTGVTPRFNGYPPGTRAGQLAGVVADPGRRQRLTTGEKFMKGFGKPERLLTCECERSDAATLSQAFQLITGELLNQMLSDPDNRLSRLLTAGRTDKEIVEEFYLAALCRTPTPQEAQATAAYVAAAPDRRAALEDVVWGLLNAKEFLLRH